MLTQLLSVLRSGEVRLLTGGTEVLQLTVENKTIDINLLKRGTMRLDIKQQGKPVTGQLEHLRRIAEDLKKAGLTLTVSHKGRRVLTLGFGAKPTFSQLITKTDAIEINNIGRLIHLLT